MERYRVRLSRQSVEHILSVAKKRSKIAFFVFCEDYLDFHGITTEELFRETTQEILFRIFPKKPVNAVFIQLEHVKNQTEFHFPSNI